MRLNDLIHLAFANLRRNRRRSLMTLTGVTIGVTALTALLSYGVGLQQNARSEFNALELYNTLRVTTRPSPFATLGNLTVRPRDASLRPDSLPPVPLTDSLLQVFAQIDGVLTAYPEIIFPVEIIAQGREVTASAEAVPMAFARIPSYQPRSGAFFATPTDSALLMTPSMARRLGYDEPEAIVGEEVVLKTLSLDLRRLRQASLSVARGLTTLPFDPHHRRMRVAGLLSEEEQPVSGAFRVLVPLERARTMRKITFFSTLDLLMRNGSAEGYAAVRVQLTGLDAYADVRRTIEETGVYVTSFRDQFSRLERVLLIMDLALGIIGFIALLVATLGIANTMMMNVIERAREIGVMKAVGGDEQDVQKLFLAESVMLGAGGGVTGLLLGWGLTAFLQLGVNYYQYRLGVPLMDVFHLPALLAAAILSVALFVSLIAGVAPARRAARIEPIAALRST